MNDIEYYTFQYKIPVYKIKPNQDFSEYYQIYKDEIIIDLQKRIDKAIEYIKEWQSFPHTNCTIHNELKNLLNILQGVS